MAKPKCCLSLIPLLVLAAVSLVSPVTGLGQDDASIVLEPGFPDTDGTWILPLSAPFDPAVLDIDAVDFRVARDGRPLNVLDRLAYPLTGNSGQATALVVLLDVPPLDSTVLAACSDDLMRLVGRTPLPGARTSLARCGPEIPEIVWSDHTDFTPEVVAGLLAPGQPGRLWDGVIEALTALAEPDLPGRRVLLLVSDGHEEIASRLVMTSCVEAALRARVAVYVLSLDDKAEAAADEARLRELARRTGGRMLSGNQHPARELADLLAWIGAVRGLRLAADEEPLPAEVTVEWNDARAVGRVARRQTLRSAGNGHWLVAGLALLGAGGAGYLLWRQRTVVTGNFLIRTRSGTRRFPIPRHGVTIGRDKDSNMVLKNRLVSRHHAVVRVKEGAVIITDLRSSRGTTVNGEPIRTRRLVSGDRVLIGGTVELVFQDNSTAS